MEVFKSVKRQTKGHLLTIQEDLEILDNENNLSSYKQKEKLENIRKQLSQTEKLLKDLELAWNLLRANDKQFYRAKVTNFRKRYEESRRRFFNVEDSVDKVYQLDKKDNSARYRLTDGISELYRQDN